MYSGLSTYNILFTEEIVEAIVNPANVHLRHGGGVAEAIIRKGGYSIQHESTEIGHCPVGEAVVTGAGMLPCKFVIHAVGPIMGEGYEEMKLRMATHSSLIRAQELGLRSLALPAISTGIFGYPMDECAHIMLTETALFIHGHSDMAVRIVYCLYDDAALEIFEKELATFSKNA